MARNKDIKYRFDTELLISAIEQKPCIWDTSCEDYKNRDIKNKAWEDIAQLLLQDVSDGEQQETSKCNTLFYIHLTCIGT